jgi:hypothetical protein
VAEQQHPEVVEPPVARLRARRQLRIDRLAGVKRDELRQHRQIFARQHITFVVGQVDR